MTNSLTLVEEMNNSNKQVYTSIDTTTIEGKAKLYNVSENADGLVKDILGKDLMLKDLFLQKYDKVNEENGSVEEKHRVILIDEAGKSYASASNGLYHSVLKLISLLGTPDTWDNAIRVQVVETKTKKGNTTYTIKPMI